MLDKTVFLLHKWNKDGTRNKNYELNVYLIKKYITNLLECEPIHTTEYGSSIKFEDSV